VLGAGLAYQALRIRRLVLAELGEEARSSGAPLFTVLGLLLLWATDRSLGLVADGVVCVVLLTVQTYFVVRALSPRGPELSRGRRELILGTTLGYAGLSMSAWLLGVVLVRLAAAFPSA
jgi:hypothetical protein